MEYGLRRYEATQRLFWLLVFLVCLGFAYQYKGSEAYQRSYPVPSMSTMKSSSFWSELRGIQVQLPNPEGGKSPAPGGSDLQRGIQSGPRILAAIMIYLILVAFIFLVLKVLWLAVQFFGKYLVQVLLQDHLKRPGGNPGKHPVGIHTVSADSGAKAPDRFVASESLAGQVRRFPLPLIFHPFKRLRLILASPQTHFSAKELTEKERRTVETDWQILHQSWLPFNWIIWTLPVLAVLQGFAILYMEVLPILAGKREFTDVSAPFLTGLIPLVQAVAVAVFLKISSTLLRRIEDLYLSNLDALIYEQFLSRLPFQSGDTLILLQAMQKHFQEMQGTLRRLERFIASRSSAETKGEEGPET
ncbi:MAG: hypothetical protein HGA84_03975 [Syntrophobacteraceae bacterium]|nr:hypothetical protein [Syntrophobacteraceae bacterium]